MLQFSKTAGLSKAASSDLNIRSAFMHMVGDAAASFGVVIAGIIIALAGAYIADPIVSMIFAALVLWSSWNIFTESINVLLESTPVGMDSSEVEQAIIGVDGVLAAHDLHVWTVSLGLISASCHIVVAEQNVSNSQQIIQDVTHILAHNFNIGHSTIQVEVKDCGGHEHMANNQHHHVHSLMTQGSDRI